MHASNFFRIILKSSLYFSRFFRFLRFVVEIALCRTRRENLKAQCFRYFLFFSIFGTKLKHTGPTNSESAKDLVRISVLEEKLDLCWKFQFAV